MLDLPGPRAFIERVRRDLDLGHSVVAVFPRSLIEQGQADAVLDEIAAVSGAVLVDPAGPPTAVRVVDALGYGVDWSPTHDPLRDLAHWPALAGLAAVVRSWEHDTAQVLARWGVLQQEAGRSPEHRFRLVVGANAEQVSAAGLDRSPPLFFKAHWWWGVLDRIDTELHVRAGVPDGPADVLHHAQVIEILAWDLDLLQELTALPAGSGADPDLLIRDLVPPDPGYDPSDLPPAVLAHQRPSLDGRQAPSAAVRPLWDRGLVDLWDGRLRPKLHPALKADELATLMWRAQVRVLFPYVEEHRAELAEVFQRYARRAGLRSVDGTWELGDMYAACVPGNVGMPLESYGLLKAARAVRNDLAHGRLASPRHLARLLAAKPL